MDRTAVLAVAVVACLVISAAMVVALPPARASGPTCVFCVVEPWSSSTTNSWQPNKAICGSNTNNYGPSTSGGYYAYVYPESKAVTCVGLDNYELVSTAGFDTSNWRAGSAVAVTATFYWNLTWDAVLSIPAGGAPATAPGTFAGLQLLANVQDLTMGASVGTNVVNVFGINDLGWNTGMTSVQTTAYADTVSIAFVSVSGDVYAFNSNITADVNSYCATCTGATGLTIYAFLNEAPGYDGTMSALQVYT